MSWLVLVLCLIAMAGAIKQIRDDRRRGIGVDRAKTLVSVVGVILVTTLAIGVLVGALALGATTTAVMAFFAVFAVGMIALVVAVNRRWPRAKAP
jgi:uncharacterized membrane protein YiaA